MSTASPRYLSGDQLSSELIETLKKIPGDHKPEYCYQCAKCTSACSAARVIPEYKPHLIVALTRMGYVKELLESRIIWACSECWKCAEYCPQDVAPVEVILALKNLSVEQGIKAPEDLVTMARNVLETGYIAPPGEVMTRDFELVDRKSLELPDLKKPVNFESLVEKLRAFLGWI